MQTRHKEIEVEIQTLTMRQLVIMVHSGKIAMIEFCSPLEIFDDQKRQGCCYCKPGEVVSI